MPFTLAHDGILHGLLYGKESLADQGTAPLIVERAYSYLLANPYSPPQLFGDVAALRFECFTNRLYQCLTNLPLQPHPQPEVPRLVGHTLRLLNLLQAAYCQPANSPPPALELSRTTNNLSLFLFGEPYVSYALQYSDTLSPLNWTSTTVTNWQDGQAIALPYSGGGQRFYRAVTLLPPMQ